MAFGGAALLCAVVACVRLASTGPASANSIALYALEVTSFRCVELSDVTRKESLDTDYMFLISVD